MKLKTAFLAIAIMVFTYHSSAMNKRDTIYIGIYVESIYNIDLTAYSADLTFWIWGVKKIEKRSKIDKHFKIDSIKSKVQSFLDSTELTNAEKYEFVNKGVDTFTRSDTLFCVASALCRATVYELWYLHMFPLEEQKLQLKLENYMQDTTQLLLLKDYTDTLIIADSCIKGWEIDTPIQVQVSVQRFPTNFGYWNDNIDSTGYSSITYSFPMLKGKKWVLCFNLLFGLLVAFLVALVSLLIEPKEIDARFALSVGGLFAAVGNKYVVDGNLPKNQSMTLIDAAHEIIFVLIFVIILFNIVTYIIYKREKDKIEGTEEKENTSEKQLRIANRPKYTIAVKIIMLMVIITMVTLIVREISVFVVEGSLKNVFVETKHEFSNWKHSKAIKSP